MAMQELDLRPVSAALFSRAKKVIAGGVSSDARRPMPGQVPLYVERSQGAYVWDVDGQRYLDFVMGQGPMVLGHCAPEVVAAIRGQAGIGLAYSAQHELEVTAAELFTSLVPCADLVRFNTVGSEAAHGAWRIARGATGRQRIVKFEGHYHGWLDPALWSLHPKLDAAGPANAPLPVAGTKGQQTSTGSDLLIAPWNDLAAFKAIMDRHGHEVAAVVMEPILCNTGCIEPDPSFLDGVIAATRAAGGLVIFDEVITGFRLGTGGAQGYLGVVPDIAIFGKAIAGGMPVAAIGGRRDVMDVVTRGEVGHAGTFNSNPLGMAAAVATLQTLSARSDDIYPHMYRLGDRLKAGLTAIGQRASIPLLVDGPGPMLQTYFTEAPAVRNYRDFARTDKESATRFHEELFNRRVNIVPRGLWLLSAAHTEHDIDYVLETVEAIFARW